MKKELLKTFPNLGAGHDIAYEYIESIKEKKATGRFRLPRNRPRKTAEVTFGVVEVNFEDRTLEVYKITGILEKTTTEPFADVSIFYSIKVDGSERGYIINRGQVLDFTIIEKQY